MSHMIGGLIIKISSSYFGGQDFMTGQIRPGQPFAPQANTEYRNDGKLE